ncbi:ribosome maturation factor RimP [Oceanivirga salmonicida]|uniref:ribosome maturation factor RimP n=1 Tax=Oceanivirga salmonicida TaxID=1769291 RepID=UPI0012E1D5F2|nr:ribosome maturation factor RimP [Oceanivirga salmonicida]
MLEKLEKKFQNAITDENIEILYVDYESDGGYNYLRVYLEKKDGSKVSLDDCENVSRVISDLADNEINEKFMLEVSSPGLERKLKKERDFLKFIGHNIKVKTISNIEGTKSFEGKLENFEDSNIHLFDNKIGKVAIPISKIKSANNIFDFNKLKELGEANEG